MIRTFTFGDLHRFSFRCSLSVQISTHRFAPQLRLASHPNAKVLMNNRGAVLSITLAFVLAFTMLGFSTIYLATMQNEAADKQIFSEKAFWLAEAGIQRALWEVKSKSCQNIPPASSGDIELSSTDDGLNENFDIQARYDLKMDSACSEATSTGSFHSKRTIKLTNPSRFKYAIYADKRINMHNTIIDSYKSGPKGGQLRRYGEDLGGGVINKFENGDVGSNGVTPEGSPNHTILITGQESFIHGDVSTGPGGVVSVQNNKEISDFMSEVPTHENNIDLPPVLVPDLDWISQTEELKIDNDKKSFTISSERDENGKKYTADEKEKHKNYKYPSIDVRSGGKLYIEGDVRIYLTETSKGSSPSALQMWSGAEVIIKKDSSLTLYTDGQISMHNGSYINNSTEDPKRLTIRSTYSSTNEGDPGVAIWNHSNFFGAIYAPDARISITNNGNVFGAFVGKNFFVVNGVNLHYDQSLAGEITDSTVVWQEISNP